MLRTMVHIVLRRSVARHSSRFVLCAISALCLCHMGCSYPLDSQGGNDFAEDFESINRYDDLFGNAVSGWTYSQRTIENNSVLADSEVVHSGRRSLRCFATTGGEIVSKASIAKSNLYLAKGDLIEFSGWYYIVGTASLPYLFLVDLEENVAIGAGPGMRLAFDEDGMSLEVERNKMGATTIHQSAPTKVFPRNRWVHVVYHARLSQDETGTIKVWQDDVLVLEADHIQTMPHDILYFIQGSKGVYNSLEVGITANATKEACTVYVDDVHIRKVE